ncbi:MAG: PQQ-binding-like beta-propeller repeat protein, partial [Pirellulaceae bacterium]
MTRRLQQVVLWTAMLLLLSSELSAQENWPQFRGTAAAGISIGDPPVTWNAETGENVLWKTRIPGLGHSAPIVWGDRVFVTTATNSVTDTPSLKTGWQGGTGDPAEDSGTWTWQVLCVDKYSGEILWTKDCAKGEPEIERHLKASHANCTAATDGEFIVAFFGSEGLHCLNFEGDIVWQVNFGRLHSGPYNAEELEWGFASSPIIYQDMVIVQCDCLNTGFVAILDLKSGEEVRRIDREDVATWSTPAVVESGGRTQIVCNGYKQMAGYDLETGEQLWTLSGGGDVPVPTPLFAHETIYITNGHGRSPTYAIAPDARGDLTPGKRESDDEEESEKDDSDDKQEIAEEELPEGLVWYQSRDGSYMPTPIIVGDYLYTCNDNGRLAVRDAKTGELMYKQRVTQGSTTFSTSAVATADRIYFSSEQ